MRAGRSLFAFNVGAGSLECGSLRIGDEGALIASCSARAVSAARRAAKRSSPSMSAMTAADSFWCAEIPGCREHQEVVRDREEIRPVVLAKLVSEFSPDLGETLIVTAAVEFDLDPPSQRDEVAQPPVGLVITLAVEAADVELDVRIEWLVWAPAFDPRAMLDRRGCGRTRTMNCDFPADTSRPLNSRRQNTAAVIVNPRARSLIRAASPTTKRSINASSSASLHSAAHAASNGRAMNNSRFPRFGARVKNPANGPCGNRLAPRADRIKLSALVLVGRCGIADELRLRRWCELPSDDRARGDAASSIHDDTT